MCSLSGTLHIPTMRSSLGMAMMKAYLKEDLMKMMTRNTPRQKTAETIAVLDSIFPDRPAVLLCGSTVSCIMNTAASNIVNETAEEEMVQYITAPYILNLLIPFDFEPIYEEACLRIQEDLSAGFTSVINLGSPDYFEALYQDALISLYNDDSLDQRFLDHI